MRRLVVLTILAVLSMGASGKLKRLSAAELAHFHALEVFLDQDEEKAFLKQKTEELRNEWLKTHGGNPSGYGPASYWEMYYQYDEDLRAGIGTGAVKEGWPEAAVFMAWGKPFKDTKLTGRKAERSVLYEYRMELHEGGQVIVWVPDSKTAYKAINYFRYEVYVDDGVVTEMVKKDAWK